MKRKSVLDYDEEEQMRLAIQASMMPDSDNEYTDMIPSEGEEEPLNSSNWSNEDNKVTAEMVRDLVSCRGYLLVSVAWAASSF